MKLGDFLLITFFAVVIGGLAVFYFHDYLFARSIDPTSHTALQVRPGQDLKIDIGSVNPTSPVSVKVCGQGTGALGCYPLVVNSQDSPLYVRLPIGYHTGPATLQVTDIDAQANTNLLYTIYIEVE